jgi:hypothetical protein
LPGSAEIVQSKGVQTTLPRDDTTEKCIDNRYCLEVNIADNLEVHTVVKTAEKRADIRCIFHNPDVLI